jgi:hypothetical protein
LVIAKTRSVSPARKLRSDPGCPRISPEEMPHARPALLTVFSTTQLELPKTEQTSPSYGFVDAFRVVNGYELAPRKDKATSPGTRLFFFEETFCCGQVFGDLF